MVPNCELQVVSDDDDYDEYITTIMSLGFEWNDMKQFAHLCTFCLRHTTLKWCLICDVTLKRCQQKELNDDEPLMYVQHLHELVTQLPRIETPINSPKCVIKNVIKLVTNFQFKTKGKALLRIMKHGQNHSLYYSHIQYLESIMRIILENTPFTVEFTSDTMNSLMHLITIRYCMVNYQ